MTDNKMKAPDRSIIYTVSKNGHVMGDFDIERLAQYIDWGELSFDSDHYNTDDIEDWRPLSDLKGEVAAAKANPPQASATVVRKPRTKKAPPVKPKRQLVKPSLKAVPKLRWGMPLSLGIIAGCVAAYVAAHFLMSFMDIRPEDRIVVRTVDRVVEKVVEVPGRNTFTPEAARLRDLGIKVESARELGNDEAAIFPFVKSAPVYLKVSVVGGVIRGAITEARLRDRIESLLRSKGFHFSPDRNSVETEIEVELQVFGTAPHISGHYAFTLRQRLHVGKGDVWRKGRFPVWRGSKYFTGYDDATLSLVPLLSDELSAAVVDALTNAGIVR
jgi:hypothetical protein